ncbi:MAG: hypothetical protein ACLFQV_03660 [Vulcanimicrobiota bacterium]
MKAVGTTMMMLQVDQPNTAIPNSTNPPELIPDYLTAMPTCPSDNTLYAVRLCYNNGGIGQKMNVRHQNCPTHDQELLKGLTYSGCGGCGCDGAVLKGF